MAHPQMTITIGYGIRACVVLAKSNRLLPARYLAGLEGVSSSYMGQILNQLRAGGLLVSTSGAKGGYRLSRPAAKITVGQIIESIDGPPREIPANVPPKIRRQLKRACRELHAIRLSEL